MKKPDNYEEAKIIIQNTVDSEFDKGNRRVLRNRAIFATTASVSLAAVFGLIESSTLAFLATLPVSGVVLAVSLIPILIKHNVNKNIKSGEFFKTKSKAEIMNMANNYVDQVNKYEDNIQKGKSGYLC